ncbi:MAG: DUF4345 domain-containing protein [Pseudomonadales bacterium]|nr:DUF4345 domain-containing protein [Pseudomonadales bacterium]
MSLFPQTLRVVAVAIFGIATIHVLFGPTAETWLGAVLSDQSLGDPVLDSQNRFYGGAFALYGAVMWLAAKDLARYQTIFVVSQVIFFTAGLARLLAIINTGWPSSMVLFLLALELLVPPILVLLYRRANS